MLCSVLKASPSTLAMRCVLLLGLCLGLMGLRPLAAQAPSDADSLTLREALRQHRHPIRVNDNTLRGAGGTWLRDRALDAAVITLGEMHATQEIPALMAALIADLQRADAVDYLAIENSPWTTRLMTDRLRAGPEAYDTFIEQHPAAIPFYNLQTERDLLLQVIQHRSADQPLWGLDQLFMFSTDVAFNRLEELAPSAEARAAVQSVRSAGEDEAADDPRLQNLPSSLPTPLTAYTAADFDTLQAHFAGIDEAQTLLDELATSAEIYRLNDTDNYVSNQLRARYLRENLWRRFEAARDASTAPPRIVVKIGAFHAYRGRTPNNALDVGNLAVAMAEAMGEEALNVAVLCGPGSQSTDFPAGTSDCWPDRLGADFEALAQDEAVLFDLTALHPMLHDGLLTPSGDLERILWAFDAIVLIPNAQPAQPIAPPTGR